MATPYFTPAEIEGFRRYMNAKIDEASQKVVQNLQRIEELALRILDLGEGVPPLEEPVYVVKPNLRGLAIEFNQLQQKIQWQEKKIQELGSLVERLQQRVLTPLLFD